MYLLFINKTHIANTKCQGKARQNKDEMSSTNYNFLN